MPWTSCGVLAPCTASLNSSRAAADLSNCLTGAAMPGTMIEFKANGRTATGYLSRPTSPRGHGILVLQEYWGLVDHIKDVADRFAAEGFVALAPDLYHGDQAKSPDEAGKLMMALNIAETAKDLRGAADALIARDDVAPKQV